MSITGYSLQNILNHRVNLCTSYIQDIKEYLSQYI